jgi:putative ABC transport system permease protein
VGVVPDLLATGLTSDASDPMLYLPLDRARSQLTSIAVRARDVDAQLLLDLRQTVRSVESDAVVDVATAGELLYASIARERFTTMLLSVFATLALALAAVGVYGVLSQVVIARTREIGVRMALGANAVAITTDVMRGGATATLAGLTVGAFVAIAGIRALRSEIFGLSHGRVDVFATAAVILLVVALASMLLPALRAARMDPLRAIATD